MCNQAQPGAGRTLPPQQLQSSTVVTFSTGGRAANRVSRGLVVARGTIMQPVAGMIFSPIFCEMVQTPREWIRRTNHNRDQAGVSRLRVIGWSAWANPSRMLK